MAKIIETNKEELSESSSNWGGFDRNRMVRAWELGTLGQLDLQIYFFSNSASYLKVMVGFDWQLMVVGLEIAQDHFWFIFLSLDLSIDIKKLWEWWVHLNYNISIRSFFDHEFWIWLGPGTMDQDQDPSLTIFLEQKHTYLLLCYFSSCN